MKKAILLLVILLGFNSVARAQYYGQQTYVNGYTRQNGTYVQPYYRTMPDNNIYNNRSFQAPRQPVYVQPMPQYQQRYINPNSHYMPIR